MNKHHRYNNSRGSALIIALILALGIGIMVASYLKLTSSEIRRAEETFLNNSLLNLAEGGAEEAVWSLNIDDWTGWTDYTTHMVRRFARKDIGNGNSGVVTVIVWNYAVLPTVYVEALAISMDGKEQRKQLNIDLVKRSLFANGLTAKDTLRITGGAASTDSYVSNPGGPNGGFPDPVLNRGDKGDIGSTTIESSITGVDIGNSDIYGHVLTGGSAISFGSGTVTGANTPVGVAVDTDLVSYDFTADLPDVDPPVLSLSAKGDTDPDVVTLGGNNNTVTLGGGTPDAPVEYNLSSFDMGNNSIMTITGNILMRVNGDVSLSDVNIAPGARLTIYVAGDMESGQGNSVINNGNPNAESLLIYGTQSAAAVAGGAVRQTIDLGGSAMMTSAVYAPNADITIHGNAGFNGAAVGNQITLNGGVEFHYDEGLIDFFGGGPTFRMSSWGELIMAEDRIDFSNLSDLANFTAP